MWSKDGGSTCRCHTLYNPVTTKPTAAFSIALDCQLDNVPGTLGRLCTAIGEAGGNIGALDGFDVRGPTLRRSLVVHCRDEAHQA